MKSVTAQLSIHAPKSRRRRLPQVSSRPSRNASDKLSLLARPQSVGAQHFIQLKHEKNTSLWRKAKAKIDVMNTLQGSVANVALQGHERLPQSKPTYQISPQYSVDFDVVKIILAREAVLDALKDEQDKLKIMLTYAGLGYIPLKKKGAPAHSLKFGFIGGNKPGATGLVPAAARNKLLRDLNVCTSICLRELYRWKKQMALEVGTLRGNNCSIVKPVCLCIIGRPVQMAFVQLHTEDPHGFILFGM
jgi:hypothetical protein